MNSYRIDWTDAHGVKGFSYVLSRSMFHAIAKYHVENPDVTIVAVKYLPN